MRPRQTSCLGRVVRVMLALLLVDIVLELPRVRIVGLAILLLVGLRFGFAALWRFTFPGRATRVLIELGLATTEEKPRLKRVWRRRQSWELAWRMPTGATVSVLQRRREAVEEALDCTAEFWFDQGLLHLKAGVARLPRSVAYPTFYSQPVLVGELPVGIGVSREGPLWVNLAALPHLLVGGQTGGGKSATIRQMVTWLVTQMGPEHVRVVLVDLKGGLEFNLFQHLPHLWAPIARDVESANVLFSEVGREMMRRQQVLEAAGVEDVRHWNATWPDRQLPYVLVVCDEIAELSVAESVTKEERARRQEALAAVSRLARLGRATGLHLILSTQRPDADALPGQVKANIPATIAFRVRSEINSRILLGEGNTAASSLPPRPGRGIWQWDRETQFQAIWLSKKDAQARLDAMRLEMGRVPTESRAMAAFGG